jgi:hypothetical protein
VEYISGLKGLSGVSNDMRDLLASDQPDARLAIDYFVDRIGLAGRRTRRRGQPPGWLPSLPGRAFPLGRKKGDDARWLHD